MNLGFSFSFYTWVPGTFSFLADRPLAGGGKNRGGGGGGRIPVRRLAGGEGKAGENGEEVDANL